MTTLAVIPARFGATRFPGKPLARETGKYLVQHVYEQAKAARSIDRVAVATDDARIIEAVQSFGGQAVMTRADHPSGTDRVAEAAASLKAADDDLVLNVQGDEPEIAPETLDTLVAMMQQGSWEIGTLAAHFPDDGPAAGPGSPADPNCVKAVRGADGAALFFSRSLVPYPRGTSGAVDRPSRWLLHLGVYAFRGGTLRELTTGPMRQPGELEQAESLEQLRWLAAGYRIGVEIVRHRACGIDTPEDYAAFVERWRARR